MRRFVVLFLASLCEMKRLFLALALTTALILCLNMISGCAWSRGRVQTWNPDGTVTDVHCWTIVVGKGTLGANCDKESAVLASDDTGVDDNFIKMIGAATEGAAKGAKGGL